MKNKKDIERVLLYAGFIGVCGISIYLLLKSKKALDLSNSKMLELIKENEFLRSRYEDDENIIFKSCSEDIYLFRAMKEAETELDLSSEELDECAMRMLHLYKSLRNK